MKQEQNTHLGFDFFIKENSFIGICAVFALFTIEIYARIHGIFPDLEVFSFTFDKHVVVKVKRVILSKMMISQYKKMLSLFPVCSVDLSSALCSLIFPASQHYSSRVF